MYIFIVDSVKIKNNPRIVSDIQKFSKSLNIKSSVIVVSYLSDIKKEIVSNLDAKSNSVIVVGNTNFLNRIINVFNDIGRFSDTVFGFISSDTCAKFFGTNVSLKDAIAVMSQRMHKTVDLFSINNKAFFSSIECVFPFGFSCEIGSSYIFKTSEDCKLIIGNLYFDFDRNCVCNCNDGLFDCFVVSNKSKKVILKSKASNLNMNAKSIRYVIDGCVYKANSIEISPIKDKIEFIINKNSLLSHL